jgi:hypothetical protein
MSLAQFKRDVKDGSSEASKSTKQMASEMSSNSQEARGSLMLLGEEIGVHIPRHLQAFITQLPGVNAALTAAFSSIAVLARIEVIVKVVEKIQEFKKHAEEIAEALKKSGEVGRQAIHKIEQEILTLDAQLAEMKGQYLEALILKLKEIDNQNLDQLSAEFDKLTASADATLEKLKDGFFANLVKLGGDNSAIKRIKDELDETTNSAKTLALEGKKVEIGDRLTAALERVNIQIRGAKDGNENILKALEQERDTLQEQQRIYGLINEHTAKQKELAKGQFDEAETQRVEAQVKAREELTNKVRTLTEATAALLTGEKTQADIAIQKMEEQIAKVRELDEQRKTQFPGIKTFYDSQITALQEKLGLLKQEKAAQEELFNKGIIPGLQSKLPTGLFDNLPKPVFSGTKEALEAAKIQRDNTAAIAEAQKVYTSTRTAAEQLKEEIALYDELLKQGRIDQETYNRAVHEARSKLDANTIAYRELGQEIGQTIEQAALFGRSWTDALKAVVIEIVKAIVQMTILNRLKASGASAGGGGGFGGFFSSLVGGLFGGKKAKGGPVMPGHYYEWKENGHEYFAPNTPGTVVPAAQAQPKINNVTYQHIQNIETPDADSFRKAKSQLAADSYEHMAAAHARNR